MKETFVSALLIAMAVVFSMSAASAAANKAYEVKIDNFSFGPGTLTVPVGATVTWINRDDIPHVVAGKDGKEIKSPVLDTDQQFSHVFARAGTYDYYCSLHPHMTGKIIVQ